MILVPTSKNFKALKGNVIPFIKAKKCSCISCGGGCGSRCRSCKKADSSSEEVVTRVR